VAILLIATCLLIIFHREIIFWIAHYASDAKPIELDAWCAPALARSHAKVKFYLTSRHWVENFTIQTFFGNTMIVNEILWASLTEDERVALLAWNISAAFRSTAIERLFYFDGVKYIDRDTLLNSPKPLALTLLIQKIVMHRGKHLTSSMGTVFSGLSFLGPSMANQWATPDARLAAIATYLAQLNNSR
jgi:hypothetical protein